MHPIPSDVQYNIPAEVYNGSIRQKLHTLSNVRHEDRFLTDTETCQDSNTSVFYTVQCGYFSNENNANQILSSINGKYSAFIYKDQDKFRVLSGVYESDKVDQIVSELKNSNIECAKIKFSFNNDDKVEYQISSICDGYIRLLDTAFSDDVKSINTDDFKGWTNELEKISAGEKVDILNNLKEHISNLAAEISKENVPAEMEYIYTILLNFKDI